MSLTYFIGAAASPSPTGVTIPTGVDYTNEKPLPDTPSWVYSGIKFDNDGLVYRMTADGAYQSVGAWLLSGAASSYYLKRTIDSGSLLIDGGAGPQIMSTDRAYQIQETVFGNEDDCVLTFEISESTTGTPILVSQSVNLHANYGL